MSGSESIELAALEDLHAAAPASVREALKLKSLQHGPVFISIAAALPPSAIVINRALGIQADTDLDTVLTIPGAHREAGVERYFVQVDPDNSPTGLRSCLQGAGLHSARGWQKFRRGTEPVAEKQTDLDVREVGPEHGEDYGRIVCAGFDLGEAAAPWLARLPGRDGWHIFMSFAGDQPAGGGALFVQKDKAWLDLAATLPQFRRRGGQSAIMAARLKLALSLGCKQLFTCTGVAVPGDPQHSYNNILKAGFREDYVRDNYAPA